MGHSFYLDTYYQLPEGKKREMYLDAEPHLTISDFETVEKNIKKLSEKILSWKKNSMNCYNI
ncbi:hypothetical protein [Nitrosopumilus ureiphilus]|uniref:Uncharacterized protein n=1 Tax=Nitrosopumilus ureiphilus TaxID=1470067 RepID=A0A7D5M5S7_9ARCH|nr:hypothetical protein [Nitrosopumilus ureiphilus]QLH07115.1 hypothetical protein C5F50_08550 [Nitrosopumilus ureiphilus]